MFVKTGVVTFIFSFFVTLIGIGSAANQRAGFQTLLELVR